MQESIKEWVPLVSDESLSVCWGFFIAVFSRD